MFFHPKVHVRFTYISSYIYIYTYIYIYIYIYIHIYIDRYRYRYILYSLQFKIYIPRITKNGDYSETHICGVNWNFKNCDLIGQIQNWAFRLDGWVLLSVTIDQKSPLDFEVEGVWSILQFRFRLLQHYSIYRYACWTLCCSLVASFNVHTQ